MKKTLVALAVAAMAATSANAVTVYEQDGTKVELGGSLRVFLGRVGDDQRGDLKNDGSRIKLKATHDLGNGLSAFAGYQLRFDENTKNKQTDSSSNFGNPSTRELFVGLAHKDVGALSFGRQYTNADDVLQDAAYYRSAEWNPLTTRSDKSVKYRSAEWSGFSFGLDYLFGNENKDNATESYKNGYAAAAFYNFDISNEQKLNFAAVYSEDKYDGINTSETILKRKMWVLHAGYKFNRFEIAGNYGQYRNDVDNGDTKGQYALVDVAYQITDPSRVYAQWERLDRKDDSSGRTDRIANRYLAGVDYKFNKNVVPYVQYEHIRVKDSDGDTSKDNVFGVGLRVHF